MQVTGLSHTIPCHARHFCSKFLDWINGELVKIKDPDVSNQVNSAGAENRR